MGISESLIRGFQKMASLRDVIRDTHGNLSVRVGNEMAIKPSGVPYERITTVYDIPRYRVHDGLRVDPGPMKPSVDLQHHLAIYRKHLWIGSICHTHSPYAVGFAMVDEPLAVSCTEHADYFGHDIRVCGSEPKIDSWGADIDLGKDERAVLLYQHGVLTFGKDPDEAVKLAAALEDIAFKNFVARNASEYGRPFRMKQSVIDQWHQRYMHGYGQ